MKKLGVPEGGLMKVPGYTVSGERDMETLILDKNVHIFGMAVSTIDLVHTRANFCVRPLPKH